MAKNTDIISDISYTNKDFNQVYSELLDVAKKLTNTWDPSLSNESDPGVVLLKLNALIADKNNYNIDKNVLECFPLSVTQYGNARQLYDSLGYTMHWYRSATTLISFQLKDIDKLTNLSADTPVVLPAFKTVLTNSDGSIAYTLLKDVQLDSNKASDLTQVIQGTPYEYDINGEKRITISNLDADLRLYFVDTQIAENGIFIKNNSAESFDDSWKRVDNLASYPLGSKVFEFGILPNSNTCFIQFPQDIALQIQDGLNITYIVSSGLSGNIKPNTLTEISNDITFGDTNQKINEQIKIIQNYASTDGKDPEDLDSAYRNYKKTIGTFNTLVTRRDYENYLFNYNNGELASNLKVSDRTSDLNYSNYVQTLDANINKKILVQSKDTTGNSVMSAYDVNLYMLQPITSVTKSTYDQMYSPADTDLSTITSTLDDVKSAQHDLHLIERNKDLKFIYVNNYKIKGTLLTYSKITKLEAKEIESNVLTALYTNLNSRELDFGDELTYNKIVNIIESADSRIKSLVLTNINYDTTKVAANGEVSALYDSSDLSQCNELVAKMILAGNAQLFTFDDNFEYDFGQNILNLDSSDKNIKTITSEVNISIAANTEYLLKQNEIIQIYNPSLITTTQYSSFVKYYLSPISGETLTIEANQDYQLKNGEYLYLSYKDSSGIYTQTTLTYPIVIRPSIQISSSIAVSEINLVTKWETLGSGQTIDIREKNEKSLLANTPCYLILNTTDESHIFKPNIPYILKENEYFLYTSADSDELIILGSGTQLTLDGTDDFIFPLYQVDLQSLQDDYTKIQWTNIPVGNKIKTTSLDIVSLAYGTTVKSSKALSLSNSAIILDNSTVFEYLPENSTKWERINVYPYSSDNTYIQSRLIISSIPSNPQYLFDNQTITLNYVDSTQYIIPSNTYVEFNNPVVLSGGENLDARVLDLQGNLDYTLKEISYTLTDLTPNTLKRVDGLFTVNSKSIDNTKSIYTIKLPFSFNNLSNTYSNWLIPIKINLIESNVTVKTNLGDILKIFSINTAFENMTGTGTFILQVPKKDGITEIDITISAISGSAPCMSNSDFIQIGKLTKSSGLNSNEIDNTDKNYLYKISDNITDVLKCISDIDTENIFDWTYHVKDSDKVLNPTAADSFWDSNHVYNQYTIAKIDFNNSLISINPSMIS